MTALVISLLGQPHISLDGAPIGGEFFGFKKAFAMLNYLAVTGEPQTRAKLADFFWPEHTSQKALTNLRGRSGLLALRPFNAFLQRQGGATLALPPATGLLVDVVEFEQLTATPDVSIEALQQAAALYRGPFWTGFDSGDVSAEFETWVLSTRERLRSRAIDIFYRLMHYHSQWQEYDEAVAYAERLMAIEPWLEEAHRQLMLLQAYQGQRGKALAQYDLCCRTLTRELGIEPSPATTDIYVQIRDNKLAPPPPIPFLAPPLPATFVGRDAMVGTLTRTITTPSAQAPRFALTGMGGIGKTTLATHLAHALRKQFPDGVLWANALESKPEDVIESWAQMYGYDFSGLTTLAAREVAWRGATEKKSLLIVVDDVWEAAQIRPLLPSSPRCAVIMTTRNHDLAALLSARVIGVPELADEAGIALLRGVLGEERVSAEITAAQTICTLLGNLPLALEILAQRLRSRPRMKLRDIVSYLEEITSKLDMLHLEDRAVRATFELSWETLDEELREAFAQLGIFAGRSLDAAAYAAVADWDLLTARDRLEDLAALSLVKFEEGSGQIDRYRQHGLLAEFAREVAREQIDFGAAQARFATYYYQFALNHADNLAKLRPNWANFRHAIQTSHELRDWQATYGIAEQLRSAWLTQGRFDDLAASHTLAHTAAHALEDTTKIAETLYFTGLAATEQARFQDAEQHLSQSLALFEDELASSEGVIRAKLQLGRIAIEQGELDKAGELLSDSHHLAVANGDETSVARSAFRRARIAYRAADYPASEALAQTAFDIQKSHADLSETTSTLALLARIELVQMQKLERAEPAFSERLSKATDYLNQAYALTEKSKSQTDRSVVLLEFGWLHRLAGNADASAKSLADAHRLFAAMGDKKLEALSLYRLSRLYEDLGQFEPALRTARQSESIYELLQDAFNLVNIRTHIGDILVADEQTDLARGVWTGALTLAKKADQLRFVPPLEQRLKNIAA